MDVRLEQERKLSAEELLLLNCGVEKHFWESLGQQEIKPVNPKENQSWIFIGRTDAEAEALVLWSPDVKSWLIWNDPDAGKDWSQEEKGMTKDEMVGWYHQLKWHDFEQTLGSGEGQDFYSPWGYEESDTTEQMNSNQ